MKRSPILAIFLVSGCAIPQTVIPASGPRPIASQPPPVVRGSAPPPRGPARPGPGHGLCARDGAGADFQSAAPVREGQILACVEPGEEVDYYVFKASGHPAGTLFRIQFEADLQVCLNFFNQDRQRTRGGLCTSDRELQPLFLALAPNSVGYLRIEASHDSKESPYSFQVEEVPLNDPSEPNNSLESAAKLRVNQPVQGLLQSVANDEGLNRDVYRFRAKRTGTLSVVLDPSAKDSKAVIEVVDRDRNRVARDSSSNPGAVLRMSLRVTRGQVYYLNVTELYSTARNAVSGNEEPQFFTAPYTLTASWN